MPEGIRVKLNGEDVRVPTGTTVAVAIMSAGLRCRTSVTGMPRAAVCGMGICYECRATVDGVAHRRTCQTLCEPGMEIRTQ